MSTFLLIILRLIHIVAASLWVGAAIFYLFFVKPSVKAIGPSGAQFMQNLTVRRKYPTFMASVSILTILAGAALYLYTSDGFDIDWIKTGTGIGLTVGALAGVAAFIIGAAGIGPTSAKLGALGQQINNSGGKPTPDQTNALHALEKRLVLIERLDFTMLTIALLAMAVARYLDF